MAMPTLWTPYLLQAMTLPDTIVARTIPDRGLLEWTNGVLQLVVLLLAVGTLAVLIMVLWAVRDAVKHVTGTIDRLANETKPLMEKATALVGDARDTVGMLREDVERVTDAAAAISDELLNAAETTAQRVDNVNAVLDVLQKEFEDNAISAVAAIRGVRVGASQMASRLTPERHGRTDGRPVRQHAAARDGGRDNGREGVRRSASARQPNWDTE